MSAIADLLAGDLAGASPSSSDASSSTSPEPTPPRPPTPPKLPPSAGDWSQLPEVAWERVLAHVDNRSGPSLVAAARRVCRQWCSVLGARFATVPQLSCVPSNHHAVLKERPLLTTTDRGAPALNLNRPTATLSSLKVWSWPARGYRNRPAVLPLAVPRIPASPHPHILTSSHPSIPASPHPRIPASPHSHILASPHPRISASPHSSSGWYNSAISVVFFGSMDF